MKRARIVDESKDSPTMAAEIESVEDFLMQPTNPPGKEITTVESINAVHADGHYYSLQPSDYLNNLPAIMKLCNEANYYQCKANELACANTALERKVSANEMQWPFAILVSVLNAMGAIVLSIGIHLIDNDIGGTFTQSVTIFCAVALIAFGAGASPYWISNLNNIKDKANANQ